MRSAMRPDDFNIPAPDSPSPFTPGFGSTPSVVAGRVELFETITRGVASGPGHPGYASIAIGARGIGKTTLLNLVRGAAQKKGWMVLETDGAHGSVCGRLLAAAARARSSGGSGPKRELTGVQVGPVGATFQRRGGAAAGSPHDPDALLHALADLGSQAAAGESQVVILVDEMHAVRRPDVRQMASVLQNVTMRSGLPVAFIGMSLPHILDTHLADRAITFLQRCPRHEVPMLSDDEVRLGLRTTVVDHGGEIADEALDEAVPRIGGHPYKLQLLGYHAWRLSGAPGSPISAGFVREAAAIADGLMSEHLFEPSWRDLSDGDRRFLCAMAESEADQPTSGEVRARLVVSSSQVAAYRERLERAGLVARAGWGLMRFVHPMFREWVIEQCPSRGASAGRKDAGGGERSASGVGQAAPGSGALS